MEILIVDDEVTVVSLIKKHVNWSAIGIDKVWTAYNAESAKKKVRENPIDIILCDIEMPQENGLLFLAWVKEHYPDIRTMILTAYPEFHYAQTAIKLGVKQYLLKPISFADLTETVQELVREVRDKKRLEESCFREPQKESSKDSAETVVQEVMKYISLHYMEPIGRQEIEEAVHMNGDYLNRIFKSATGHSLIQYIQYYRVISAKRLMREEHTAVSEVGSRVGLDSPSYFSRIFKKWTGQTPYEYYVSVHEKK